MNGWKLPLLVGAGSAAGVTLLFVAAAALLYRDVVEDLPRLPDDPGELAVRPGTEIYAASGERIFSFNISREWARLNQVAPAVIEALLATEDAAFREHHGVDVRATIGALGANLLHGYGQRGGSTLTQQLAKRLFFSPDKTIRRKLSEILVALQLESLYARRYPGRVVGTEGFYPAYKDRLLELYLNTVFFGANAYGINDAAQVFFGVTPDRLSVPQAALLIGLINAPTAYNPLQRPERATRRLHHVLRRMQVEGYLSQEQLDTYAGLNAGDLVDPHRRPRNPAPYWVEAIKAEVAERWGPGVLRYGSLRIYTTLDMHLQRAAERAVQRGLVELDARLGFPPYTEAATTERERYLQAALVCLTPHTGQVRAMVGGRDIFVSYYNRALTARRQPGSGFKPIAYLAALEAGVITPVSLFHDEPRRYMVNNRLWAPTNFDGRYMGLTTATWALVHSANSVAVQISESVTPERIADMAHRVGFTSPVGPYRSIALGVSEVTVLEMASAYGTLVSSGLHVEPTLVDSVVDADGRNLIAYSPAPRQAVAPETAYQVLQMLRLAVERGTGRRVMLAGLSQPVAGKTGTTNDNSDAWFTGCTPRLTASVWVGFDHRRDHRLVTASGQQITGGIGAVPIWTDFISQAEAGRPPSDFPVPDGVRLVEVEAFTGLAPEGVATLADPAPQRTETILVPLVHGQQPNEPGQVRAMTHRTTLPRLVDPAGSLP